MTGATASSLHQFSRIALIVSQDDSAQLLSISFYFCHVLLSFFLVREYEKK